MADRAYRKLKREAALLGLVANGSEFDRMMAERLCGKVHFAAEMGLISLPQWEELYRLAAALVGAL